MKKAIVLFLSLLLSLLSFGQKQEWKAGIEIRIRPLLDAGYKTPQSNSDPILFYTSQRSRIKLKYHDSCFSSQIAFQDVRIWGNDNIFNARGYYGNSSSTCLFKAWIKAKLNTAISLKVGRQAFSYDDQRILSSRNWNDHQLCYDAVLLEYNNEKTSVQFAASWNSDNSKSMSYPDDKLRLINFLRAQYKTKSIKASTIYLLSGQCMNDSMPDLKLLQTFGVNLNHTSTRSLLRLSFYYQSNMNQLQGKTRAFCLSFFFEQKTNSGKFCAGTGFDFLSGDDAKSNTKGLFNLLYGKRHGYYGSMDYFSETPQQGLTDLMMKFSYKPTKKILVKLELHKFLSSRKIESYGNDYGSETDFAIEFTVSPAFNISSGYSFYLCSDLLKKLKGVSDKKVRFPQFAWISMHFSPWISI